MTALNDRDPATSGSFPTLFSHSLASARPGLEQALESDEAAHLRAARVRVGSDLALTDGEGARWMAELLELGRRTGRIRLLAPLPAPPPAPIELIAPVGNRERSLWLVEKATELSVEAIRWIEAERSRSVADAARSEAFLDRARRRSVAALKQSGGAWLPRLDAPEPLEAALGPGRPGEARWMGDPDGAPAMTAANALGGAARVTILVGPEGGLTDAERAACAAAGYEPIELGRRTLRFETAAIGLAAVALAALERGAET